MAKQRKEIPEVDRWNVEALYPDMQTWEQEFIKAKREGKNPRWPEFTNLKGKLHESPETLKTALDQSLAIDRHLSKLYTYAHLRHDEDIADNTNKSAYSRITALIHEFTQEASWFEPELLSLSDEKIQSYLNAPELKDYRFHIEKIVRMKKHTLSAENEEILALAAQALETSHKAFSAISDADFKFGKVLDSQNKEHELTHGSFGLFLREQDRTLRENAFKKMHGQYASYENTLSELISGQIKKHVFYARTRRYQGCLESALYPKNIETSVYHALIQAVNDEISTLHNYIDVRRRLLGIDQLHLYDMYVPVTTNVDIKMPFDEAVELIIESVAPLGSEYQDLLKKGLKQQRWVDRYENLNKRSGGYSSGCIDSPPYILMNYKNILRDVFTLAHEAGHSMHSLLTWTNQPYQYASYPIFLAEVASTFNEELLMQLLLKRAKSPEEKIFLLNQKIEDIRATLFRQTMFAEFELLIHENTEKVIPLTPSFLKEEYRKLNTKYFGPKVTIDAEADIEWARIPHFYYDFYVYQYATGISAALALADTVTQGGTKERDAYLAFLKSGNSKYPIETLKVAGVDMRSPAPVKAAIKKFGNLVQQLDELTKQNTK